MAVPLFIYAATIYRFINCDDAVPDDRLQAVLSSHLKKKKKKKGMVKSDDEYGEHSQLTDIYFPVLEHIISRKKETELRHWMDDFRRIMGAVVLLFSPLSSASLAKLICSERQKSKADWFLSNLWCQYQRTVVPLSSFFASHFASFWLTVQHLRSFGLMNRQATHSSVGIALGI